MKMKSLFASLLAVSLLTLTASATEVVTNQVPNLLPPLTDTNAATGEVTKHDITLSAGGQINHSGHADTALDFSYSANPFTFARPLWLGVSQALGWKPFAGSTDLDANWCLHVFGNLYTLPGVSGGLVYGSEGKPVWRTGPELQAQYYLKDDVYIIGQVNYDIVTEGKDDTRWSIGIGYEF